MFLHSLICMSDAWRWRFTKSEMTAINEITAKIDQITFCSRLVALSGCEKELTRACSCKKLFRKFQQISANLSNCDGVYFEKRIISTTSECALKKTSATIVFLYCDMEIAFPLWIRRVFPLINDLMICKYTQMHKEG